MSHQQLHDFASTPDAGLPEHADSGTAPVSRYHRWIGHRNGSEQSVFPGAHIMEGVTHKLGKTTDEGMDSGGWISRMTSSPNFHKGALTAKANKAGESPMEFAHSHASAPGRTGKQARAAINMQK
jgi:hypothetical protein